MSLSLPEITLILFVLALAVAAGAYFFSKTRIEPAGIVRANDFTDEKIRQAIIRAVKGVDVAAMTEEDAEHHLEELARHAIAAEYANIYRGLKVEVTHNWPDAKCMIVDNIAVIRPWVGHSILGGSTIRSVKVEVNRQPALKLDTRRPIKAAFDELHAPPPKVAPKPQAAEKPTVSRIPRKANKG